jgi:citrate synthase
MARMLESEEAARRLGVKLPTLYAYVSRGLLASHPSAGSRRSLFDAEDLERLARRSRGGRRVESRLATVTTAVTQLRGDGPAYRGRAAIELAVSTPYEEVADLLWGAGPGPWEPVSLGPPPTLGTSELLRWAALMTGAGDPLRADLRPEAVTAAARRLLATMIETLPVLARRGGAGDSVAPGPVAARLSARLVPVPSPQLTRAVNSALIVLADHELATSTVAVRVAASTRADLYDAVLAGLATLAGPLHGGASQLAYGLLVEAERHGPERALNDTLRWQGALPGFGHTVYEEGDPRAGVLLECFAGLADADQRALVATVIGLAADHGIPPCNVDLALAAITWATGMAPDAGRTIFTLARLAGWTAHYLEELGERPLRFRARAVYATAG